MEGLAEVSTITTTSTQIMEDESTKTKESNGSTAADTILHMELDADNEEEDHDYVPSDQSDLDDAHLSGGSDMDDENEVDDIEVDDLVKDGVMEQHSAIRSSPHITVSRRTSVQQALPGTNLKMPTSRNTRVTSGSSPHHQ
jgi:hypothetical protein